VQVAMVRRSVAVVTARKACASMARVTAVEVSSFGKCPNQLRRQHLVNTVMPTAGLVRIWVFTERVAAIVA
jgi:hypothetical protein